MKIFLLVILVLALALLALSYALFYIGIVRFRNPRGSSMAGLGEYMLKIQDGIDWFTAQERERVELPAHDGVQLVGEYLPARGEARATLILFHGYRTEGYRDFAGVYKLYHDWGYSLLNVSQRAHNLSSGKYITFGVKESADCLCWAQYVCDRFGPEHPTFLCGLSMGASTVLMASGLELPANVRGITADSPYSSPYEELAHVLRTRFHLPAHPLIDIADVISRVFAGFSFRDNSALDAVRHSTTPTVFISGEADDFVPHRFTLELYDACAAEKELVTVPGAGHGMSYLIDSEKCVSVIKPFFEKHLQPRG